MSRIWVPDAFQERRLKGIDGKMRKVLPAEPLDELKVLLDS